MAMDPSERQEAKNPGDRGYGFGNEVTLTLDPNASIDGDQLDAGFWVELDGAGGVTAAFEDTDSDGNPDSYTHLQEGVLKHSAEPGDEVTVHLSGVVRADGVSADVECQQIDSYDDGTALVRIR